MAFRKKAVNHQTPRVDRFVPTRDYTNEVRRRRSLCPDKMETLNTIKVWDPNYFKNKKYAIHLDEAFGLEPLKIFGSTGSYLKEEHYLQSWPCVPRKKRYLSTGDSILDLPTYSDAPFSELLDWSKDNIIVAALNDKYYNWSLAAQSLTSSGFSGYPIQCCKFDPRGVLLVLGTDRSRIELHSIKYAKWVNGTSCSCLRLRNYCSITTIDWSPTGNSFVSGCSRGIVSVFNRSGHLVSCVQTAFPPLHSVRVSPDARYVAISAVNMGTVLILIWPELKTFIKIRKFWSIQAITWHPWKSALLGIGAMDSDLKPRVALWDVPPDRLRESNIGDSQHFLEKMLFSNRTGELVISLGTADGSTFNYSRLEVLSDLNTVVDQACIDVERIKTMVLSPEGTKLATATNGEDLIIWNFFTDDNHKKIKKLNRYSKLPVYIDITMNGSSVR